MSDMDKAIDGLTRTLNELNQMGCLDPSVVRDARLQLECAVRRLRQIERYDPRRYQAHTHIRKLANEALANIHAAEARLK